MDKSQYHPPQTVYSAELYAQIEKSALQNSPERRRGPFKFIEQIATLVDSFRDTAVAIEQQKGREVRVPLLPIVIHLPARHPKLIHKDLIEQERVRGGRIFKGGYFFWLGDKADSPIATKEVHDWFLAPTDGYSINEAEIIHIESSPDHLLKFNAAGQPLPMTIQDIERFVPAAYHYAQEVLEIYPFEKDRAEVILDGMDIPDDVAVLLPPMHPSGQQDGYKLAA